MNEFNLWKLTTQAFIDLALDILLRPKEDIPHDKVELLRDDSQKCSESPPEVFLHIYLITLEFTLEHVGCFHRG